MATSELSNRLDCLTSFSSQLVFVCSDKVKQQSQIVESFIGQQNEDTNLAIITANELTPLVSYRETLYKQLISQEKIADFNLPLNQLLVSLNKHDGPVLISLFQADRLPVKLIKELWELVLQSRFAKNKQHLNVLLIGKSDWAEKIKNGLGARSKEKPILLNGHSFHSNVSETLSTNVKQLPESKLGYYEPLNQDEKSRFSNTAIYKKWASISLALLVFFVSFSGILYWLYSDQIKQTFGNSLNTFEIFSFNSPQPEREVAVPLMPSETPLNQSKVKAQETQLVEKVISVKEPNLPVKDIASDGQKLVTDWQTASEELSNNRENIIKKLSTNEENITPLESTIPQENEQNSAISDDEVSSTSKEVTDYKVEDVAIVELTPLNLTQEAQTESTESPSSKSIENVLQTELLTDQSALLTTLPNSHFVIQIAAMSNFTLLQEYVADKKLSQHLWLYTTQRYGGDWYVLLYNQDFSSIEQARQKTAQLPVNFLDNVPFAKPVSQVQQEIPLL
ncbi:SPOR domain-containing protein [Paraglaciecola sp.]|uniref:SPOR domain-containing protein n=1 Tax=Paraglaciecola sp. TaxID=1920173 RepID=UPI003EF09CA4